jgi:hypothetical protein
MFLTNIVMTLGVNGALGLFKKSELPASELVPGMDLTVQPEDTKVGVA